MKKFLKSSSSIMAAIAIVMMGGLCKIGPLVELSVALAEDTASFPAAVRCTVGEDFNLTGDWSGSSSSVPTNFRISSDPRTTAKMDGINETSGPSHIYWLYGDVKDKNKFADGFINDPDTKAGAFTTSIPVLCYKPGTAHILLTELQNNTPVFTKTVDILVNDYVQSDQRLVTEDVTAASHTAGTITMVGSKVTMPNEERDNFDVSPVVAQDDSGNFAVAYIHLNVPGGHQKIFLQRFDHNGKKIGGEMVVNSSSTFNDNSELSKPRIAMDKKNGNFFIAWITDAGDAHLQSFDNKGQKTGSEIVLSESFIDDIGFFDNGGAYYAYSHDGKHLAQMMSGQGSKTGAEFEIHGAYVLGYGSGNLLVVNRTVDGSYGSGDNTTGSITAQRFDSNGHSSGSMINIQSNSSAGQFSVEVDAKGNFVVIWMNQQKTTLTEAPALGPIYAQKFDLNGTKVGDAVKIADLARAFISKMDDDGNLLIGWAEPAGSGTSDSGQSFADIVVRLFTGDIKETGKEFRFGGKGDENFHGFVRLTSLDMIKGNIIAAGKDMDGDGNRAFAVRYSTLSASSGSNNTPSSTSPSPSTSPSASTPVNISSGTIFTDVNANTTHSESIGYLKDKGIAKGNPDGSYHPNDFIDRASFTTIVMRVKYADQAGGSKCFPDVNDEWYAGFVCLAKAKGFIGGYPNGHFIGWNNVTLSEAAKIILSAFGIKVQASDPWYKAYIQELAKRGAIPKDITMLNQKITRAQMAEIIHRLLENITDQPSQRYEDLR